MACNMNNGMNCNSGRNMNGMNCNSGKNMNCNSERKKGRNNFFNKTQLSYK